MKKFILLIGCLFIFTGCSIKIDMSENSVDNYIKTGYVPVGVVASMNDSPVVAVYLNNSCYMLSTATLNINTSRVDLYDSKLYCGNLEIKGKFAVVDAEDSMPGLKVDEMHYPTDEMMRALTCDESKDINCDSNSFTDEQKKELSDVVGLIKPDKKVLIFDFERKM